MLKREEVEHIAKLAKLNLTEHEIQEYTQQLNQIVDYMEKLKELDTREVPPTTHALPNQNVFRDDIAHPSLDIESVLKNAPDREGNYFKVPRIL